MIYVFAVVFLFVAYYAVTHALLPLALAALFLALLCAGLSSMKGKRSR